MINIFKIFFRDIKKIVKNPIAIITIIGVCFIPALYAWFNIVASWDPYGSTVGIKVAVSNVDTGYSNKDLSINIGDEIISNLKANKQIGWEFIDKDETIDGVKSGKYYAGIVIPKNFSKDLASVLDGELKYPKFEYYINQKKNAIAPKITDKGVGVIQQELNTTFVKTIYEVGDKVLKIAYDRLNDVEKNIFGKIKETLDKTNSSLEDYKSTIDVFSNTSDSIKSLMGTTKIVLPAVTGITENGQNIANETQALLHSAVGFSDSVNNLIYNILDNADFIIQDILNNLENINLDIADINDIAILEINNIIKKLNRLYDVNTEITRFLRNINNILPIHLKGIEHMAVKLDNINQKYTNIISSGKNIKSILNSGEKLTQDLKRNLQAQIKDINNDLQGIRSFYYKNVKPDIDKLAEKNYRILNDLGLLMLNTQNGVSQINKILDESIKAIESGNKALVSTKGLLDGTQKSIKDLKGHVQKIENDIKSDKLAKILANDPNLLATFISAPVGIENISFYEIENYGSAMSPFYSTLALWVGGIVLVSLLKVKVYEDENIKNIKYYQSYFGRYLLFMMLGIAQALIICLGDLYFLKIQCLNPSLFILSGIVASIVFTNIIYTLTVSFGDIGKALCVFLLVIQVAGSGGTFPIEVTPQFFQKLYPLLPFTYSINGMRETIAGIYENNFYKDIIYLLSFIPFSLILGIILRIPLVKLNEFFEEKLEETNLI